MKYIVSAAWLNENLQDQNLLVLDASLKKNPSGKVSDYAGQRIQGARYLNLDKEFSDPKSSLPHTLPPPQHFEESARRLGISNDSKIVVYDNLGMYTAARVWWMFRVMGHFEVAVLDGGLPAWVKLAYETEPQVASSHEPGDFTARFDPGLVKHKHELLANIERGDYLVIDARSAGRFNGTEPEPRAGLRGGHIPNSLNIPFSDVLVEGRFKSKTDLKNLFHTLEINQKPLIFTCGSGVTACITLLAAEQVVSNPKYIYDGSWTEWAQDLKLPIEKS